MGLRVIPYGPEDTRDDAAPGFVGFVVVLARRNAMAPDAVKATPIKAMAGAIQKRASAGTS